MNNPAIIVIAYNRDESLFRVLDSLFKADFSCAKESGVPLIISIDKSDNQKVTEIAENFEWPFGEKRVVTHDVNLGLKKHVIECGKYVDEFDAIVVLEDDLYVSGGFYKYACEALDFTSGDERIAGVSLYNHLLNVHVREPFEAINDDYDNYYMQFAQSWGQAYTREQWNGFMSWMKENEACSVAATNVPVNVSSWSDKSWLKYYIKYVIDSNKFFMYPRVSYTTNFGDEGTHARGDASDLQVPLAPSVGRNSDRGFCFSSIDESQSVYDAFFESLTLKNILEKELKSCEVSIDLYGYKPSNSERYCLSSKALSFKIVKAYGRKLRPVDTNIIEGIPGKDFYLYDTSEPGEAPTVDEALRVLYNYRALNFKKIKSVIKYRLLKR